MPAQPGCGRSDDDDEVKAQCIALDCRPNQLSLSLEIANTLRQSAAGTTIVLIGSLLIFDYARLTSMG